MGKEQENDDELGLPVLSIEEQVRDELRSIQKGQRQLSDAETECFIVALGGVLRAQSLMDLKILASGVKQKIGRKPYDQELEMEFFRRRYSASSTDESMQTTLNHLRVLLAQQLILQEQPETKFLGYTQRIVRVLSPVTRTVNSREGKPIRTVRVNKNYL